jgi:tetratricopeptide (TPR) repeat protein
MLKRLITLLLIGGLILSASSLRAQESMPEPAPAVNLAELEALLAEMERAADRARAAAEDASRYAGDASSFLNIFEALGIVITLAAAALGVFGFRQLFQTRAEVTRTLEADRRKLDDALARFAGQIETKEGEIDALSRQLIERARHQQEQIDHDRQRFQNELDAKERAVSALNQQIRDQAAEQREEARKTSLALSLLPLGERQYRMQDYSGALATYERALELDEDNPIIHYRLGYVHFQLSHIEFAERCLLRSLEIEPDFPPSLAALGYIYRRQAEKMPETIDRDIMMNKAENLLLTALKMSDTLVDEDGESWWGSLGGLYRRRHQIDQAIAAYQRAAKVTPFSSYPFGNLAMLYSEKRDIDATLKSYEQVERLARDEALAEVGNYYGYADLLTARLVLGKVKEAEDTLESVFYTAPAPYALQSLVDTLETLLERLGGETAMPQIAAFLPRIKAEVARREQGESADKVVW